MAVEPCTVGSRQQELAESLELGLMIERRTKRWNIFWAAVSALVGVGATIRGELDLALVATSLAVTFDLMARWSARETAGLTRSLSQLQLSSGPQ